MENEVVTKPALYKPTTEIATDVQLLELFDRHIYWLSTASGERVPIPSVTTQLQAVSNEFIPRLRGDIGNREADARMNQAGMAGRRIHYASYVYTKGGVVLYDYPQEININPEWREKVQNTIAKCQQLGVPYYVLKEQEEYVKFLRAKAWHDIVNPVVHYAEISLGSIEEFAAGTVDKIIEIPETKTFSDIAGSRDVTLEAGYWIYDEKNGFYDKLSAQMQVAEYMILAEKNLPLEFKGTIIVHTNATTGGKNPKLSTYVTGREEAHEWAKKFKAVQTMWLAQNPNWKPEVETFNPIAMRKQVEEGMRSGEVLPLPERVEPKAVVEGEAAQPKKKRQRC